MVLEALGHGRHVLWTYPFPGCTRVSDGAKAREEIVRLSQMHERGELRVNEEGAQFMASETYNPRLLKKKIQARLETILQA